MVRIAATTVMSIFGVLAITVGVASGRMDWFAFLCFAAAWAYSVLWTALIIVAFARKPRSGAGATASRPLR